tara:strand:- start:3152 stop:3367 length:216 start_codon:yes stop_codon:yes gene_type:complete
MQISLKGLINSGIDKEEINSAIISILVTFFFIISILYNLLPVVAIILLITFLIRIINGERIEKLISDNNKY